MRRLTIDEKNKIITLSKNGKSLNQICNKTKLKKTTVYYHLRKLRGKKLKDFSFVANEENIGEFVGVFAADGCFSKCGYRSVTSLYFSPDEEEYAKSAHKMLSGMFSRTPLLFWDKNNKIYIIRFNSKDIKTLLKTYLDWDGKKTYSVQLKSIDHTREFLLAFLRGYLDSDGFCNNDTKKASFFGVSKNMLDQIDDIVKSFGVITKRYTSIRQNRKPLYFVHVTNSDAIKLIRLVRPRNEKRIRKWAQQDLNSQINGHDHQFPAFQGF